MYDCHSFFSYLFFVFEAHFCQHGCCASMTRGDVLQGAGAEVQRPVYQMHAYPPGLEGPPSTDNTPWGVALGQTLVTPRMPEPQSSPLASGPVPGPTPPQGSWGLMGVCGDAHASNSPSPAGEAALTTPTDLLLQVWV